MKKLLIVLLVTCTLRPEPVVYKPTHLNDCAHWRCGDGTHCVTITTDTGTTVSCVNN